MELGLGCLLIEHLAAHLGLDRPSTPPLWEITTSAPKRAHIVVHSTCDVDQSIDPGSLVDAVSVAGNLIRADVLTNPDLRTSPGSTVARLTLDRQVTERGFDLAVELAEAIDVAQQFPP